jgi:hypothetical protein
MATLYNAPIRYNQYNEPYGGVTIAASLLLGRTLTYHLNRLADTLINDVPQFAAMGAANLWAGTNGLGLPGALNTLYAARNAGKNYNYDIQGALNALAGTKGLGVDEAAAEIVI